MRYGFVVLFFAALSPFSIAAPGELLRSSLAALGLTLVFLVQSLTQSAKEAMPVMQSVKDVMLAMLWVRDATPVMLSARAAMLATLWEKDVMLAMQLAKGHMPRRRTRSCRSVGMRNLRAH